MRTLLLLTLLLFATTDGGGAMDPNGGAARLSSCNGDYSACVDPNGRPPRAAAGGEEGVGVDPFG